MSPNAGPLSFIPPTTLSAAMSYFEFEEVDVVSEMDFPPAAFMTPPGDCSLPIH